MRPQHPTISHKDTETMLVSSTQCSTKIFYNYMYCLSTESLCAQCIPCYNDAQLYIPLGEEYASSCVDSAICSQCAEICEESYNAVKYNENVDDISSDICPIRLFSFCPFLCMQYTNPPNINMYSSSFHINNAWIYYTRPLCDE